MPGLASFARTVVGLRPRRGESGIRNSLVGGPMVSVAQLYAADVPEIAFPEGTDLVQIVWCPEPHVLPKRSFQGKDCRVFWGRAYEIRYGPEAQPGPWASRGSPCPCTSEWRCANSTSASLGQLSAVCRGSQSGGRRRCRAAVTEPATRFSWPACVKSPWGTLGVGLFPRQQWAPQRECRQWHVRSAHD